jgi:hypothetical protein
MKILEEDMVFIGKPDRASLALLSPRLGIHRFSEEMMRNTHHLALACFCGERHRVIQATGDCGSI